MSISLRLIILLPTGRTLTVAELLRVQAQPFDHLSDVQSGLARERTVSVTTVRFLEVRSYWMHIDSLFQACVATSRL